ncbi:RDD family protein [Hanstruepera neustonica]|uniref:RDD family protein n=1 Tax=Hanstruepera neustonica TaxID=1445657 RepID=UPI0013FD1497
MKQLFNRLIAFNIDGIFIVILTYLLYCAFYNLNNKIILKEGVNLIVLGYCQLSSYFLYFFLLESMFKTTIGKKMFKIKVIYSNSPQGLWWRTLIRTIIRITPLTFIPFFLNSDRLFWHELLSNTRTSLE